MTQTSRAKALYRELDAEHSSRFMSAVDNADLTAREEGFDRGGDEWFEIWLASYESLED